MILGNMVALPSTVHEGSTAGNQYSRLAGWTETVVRAGCFQLTQVHKHDTWENNCLV